MRSLALAVAAGALLAATQANAGSFPVNTMPGVGSDLIDQVATRVYIHGGHRYCFYFSGWHGPGWYRCGYAFRRGIGWGGVYGWNDWNYGPYERRFGGRRHGGSRVGVDTRFNTNIDTRTRSTTTRSTTGGSADTGARVRGSTTGSGAGVNVQSGAGAKVQGGATGGGANVRGGANVGGGAGSSTPAASGGGRGTDAGGSGAGQDSKKQ